MTGFPGFEELFRTLILNSSNFLLPISTFLFTRDKALFFHRETLANPNTTEGGNVFTDIPQYTRSPVCLMTRVTFSFQNRNWKTRGLGGISTRLQKDRQARAGSG